MNDNDGKSNSLISYCKEFDRQVKSVIYFVRKAVDVEFWHRDSELQMKYYLMKKNLCEIICVYLIHNFVIFVLNIFSPWCGCSKDG